MLLRFNALLQCVLVITLMRPLRWLWSNDPYEVECTVSSVKINIFSLVSLVHEYHKKMNIFYKARNFVINFTVIYCLIFSKYRFYIEAELNILVVY